MRASGCDKPVANACIHRSLWLCPEARFLSNGFRLGVDAVDFVLRIVWSLALSVRMLCWIVWNGIELVGWSRERLNYPLAISLILACF